MSGALLFGELLTLGYSWRFLFQIAAVAALGVAILLTVLRFPPTEKDDSSYPRLFVSILFRAGFWLFAIAIALGASIEAALTFWSRTYVETYLSGLPRAGAIAVVVFAGAMAIGRLLAGYLSNKTSLNNIMISSAILGIVVSFFIPMATTLPTFYALLALAGLATASFWPTILAEADVFLPVNTTILFILLASAGIIWLWVNALGDGHHWRHRRTKIRLCHHPRSIRRAHPAARPGASSEQDAIWPLSVFRIGTVRYFQMGSVLEEIIDEKSVSPATG